jgi:hypothetical protein
MSLFLDRTEEKQKDIRLWDVFVLRGDGHWVGMRASWPSLRRLLTYLVVVFLIASISLVGWVWTRWQMVRLDRDLALSRQELRSVNSKIQSYKLRGASGQLAEPSLSFDFSSVAMLPSLDEKPLESDELVLSGVSSVYNPKLFQWDLKFAVERNPKSQSASAGPYYWIALLHSLHGLLSFPPALAGRSMDALLPQKGQIIEEIKGKRTVTGRFRVGDFVDSAGSEPVHVTLLIYDTRGSLILRQRHDLGVQEAKK